MEKPLSFNNIKLFMLIFAALLVGCAAQISKPAVAEAQSSNAEVSQPLEQRQVDISTPLTDQSPVHSGFISAEQEFWYKALVAELSNLRGEHELSAQYLLEVALYTADAEIAERATEIALAADNDKVAISAAELWIQLAPDNLEAQQILVFLLLRTEQNERAMGYLKNVLAQIKDNPQQRLQLISTLLEQQGSTLQALNLLSRLVESHPQDSLLLMLYARLLASAEQFDEALQVLQQLIALKPDHEQALLLYARVLDKQDKTTDALLRLQQVLTQHPELDALRLLYARMLAAETHYVDSIAQFKLLLNTRPQDVDVLYALGILSIQTEEWDAAQGYFETLLKQEEYADTARYYLGQIAESKAFSEQALGWYRAIEGGENYLSAQARIAAVLAEQDQLDAALKHLRTVPVDSHADALSLVQFEAQLLIDSQQYQQAMQVYNRALEVLPDNVDLLYSRGLLAERLDDITQSEADFRQVLALDPDNVHALNALGYTLADRTDRYAEAYDLIKRALAMRPNDYYILDSMGWVLYRLGRYEEALDYLTRAQALYDDPEIAAHLGEVLWQMGRRQEALQVWQEAVEKFPKDELVPAVMQQFAP